MNDSRKIEGAGETEDAEQEYVFTSTQNPVGA